MVTDSTVTKLTRILRDLPLSLRKKMLSQMMLSVPVVAATMTTIGLPGSLIAPLVGIIPGFLEAAFTPQEAKALSNIA